MKVALLACALAVVACTQSTPVVRSERPSVERAFSKTETFELRSKCAALANSFEDRYPKAAKDSIDVTNHYNEADNRCYVEVSGITQGFSTRQVYDGQEQHNIISCNQAIGRAFGKPICFDDHGRAIGTAEANQTANRLMAEEVNWGLPTKAGE